MNILVVGDGHARPEVSNRRFDALANFIIDKQPDHIVNIGDMADMGSLSRYDVGNVHAEGKRYIDDINCTNDAVRRITNPVIQYSDRLRMLHRRRYNPQFHITLGNHECFDSETQLMTRRGWLSWDQIEEGDEAFALLPDGTGEWQEIVHLITKEYSGPLLKYSSRAIDLAVTPNHRIVWTSNGSGKIYEATASDVVKTCDLFVSAKQGLDEYPLTDEQLVFCAVAATDSFHTKNRVTFYQSGEKANTIRRWIEQAGVEYKERSRNRDITEICGKTLKSPAKTSYEFYMERPDWCCASNKELPSWVFDLSERQWLVFLDALIFCDGTIPTGAIKSRVFYGRKEICEDVQRAAIAHGWRATLTEYRDSQWRVNLVQSNLCRVENFLSSGEVYNGIVWCVSVPSETILVRRNGKPVFTGNCRISRAATDTPSMYGHLRMEDLKYTESGWNVVPFLQPLVIEDICFQHYFTSGVMGRAISGPNSARAVLNKMHMSCVFGHSHLKNYSEDVRADHKKVFALNCGYYDEGDHHYTSEQHRFWSGLCMIYDIKDGYGEVAFYSKDYVLEKYL